MFPGAHVATHPDKPAQIMGGTGEVMTFRELDDMANRVSQLFADAGLKPGDHVAFCMENHPLFLAIAWGAHYAGLYYTAASSRLTTAELEYIVEDCEAQVFITSAYKAQQAAELVAPNVRLKLMLDGIAAGYESFEEVIARYPTEPLTDRVEGNDMLYSSGTTGRPKGVKPPLSGAPLGTPPPLMGVVSMLFGVTESSTYLSPAPL
jgi:acyl-CoA synthetase (AMP-forming)/AMP-acid ligase II